MITLYHETKMATIGLGVYNLCGFGMADREMGFHFLTKHFYMKANMGNTDRIIRVILAIVFAALYFTGTVAGTWGTVLVVLGGIFLATSVISFCPLYTLVGVNTCRK